MVGRIQKATQTIAARPDPRVSSEIMAPRWTLHRTRRSVVGKLFAKTDGAPVGLPVTDDGPLEVPSLKVFHRLGALASAGADDLAFVIPLGVAKSIPMANVMLGPAS
eukprot:743021-Pyramimonas_sp.AAC.1